jgi:N-acetylglucosaminyl-diphospho-decaprenol L-rhamnosyltransferase
MTAAVVIVTYNSAGAIGDALRPLCDAGFEIVVVDNASDDATREIVTRRHPGVRLIVNPRNVGFATAVNQGWRSSAADFVVLVNPDCVVDADTVRALVARLEALPEAAIAGPRLMHPDGTIAVSAHPFESLTSVVLSRFGGSLVPVGLRRRFSGRRRRDAYTACLDATGVHDVDWLSGACMAIRHQFLADTGGLDERYFLYYEDEDLCWQAHQQGWRVIYDADARATHAGGASSSVGEAWPHLYRSMLLFFSTHRPGQYTAVRGAVLVRSALGLTLASARRLVGDDSAPARLAAWRTIAGIAARPPRDSIVGVA